MSRKNFKVATTEDGKTTIIKIDKTPTGKVKTIKDKEQVRKEREEQYKNFRVNALRRRAKRMGLTDEQTEVKVKELLNQLDTPNSYNVLILFNNKDKDLVKQALLKEELVWKIMSDSHLIMIADRDTLKTIREIMPPSAKIHPYCIKKAAILPIQEPKKKEKKPLTKAQKQKAAKTAKKARKAAKIEAFKNRKGNAGKQYAKMRKQIALMKAKKARKATTVQLKPKKGSTAPKKASTNLKKAA
jgi:hypothetical protein